MGVGAVRRGEGVNGLIVRVVVVLRSRGGRVGLGRAGGGFGQLGDGKARLAGVGGEVGDAQFVVLLLIVPGLAFRVERVRLEDRAGDVDGVSGTSPSGRDDNTTTQSSQTRMTV